jgi:hypothetical protein
MATKKLISPQVYTFETDISDYQSNQNGASSLPSSTTSSGGGDSSTSNNNNNNNNTNFILCEDFTRLLQEDGDKLTQ